MKSDHLRASKLIGKDVMGPDNKSIGEVSDLILDKDGKIQQVVVSVGGFLGIGDKQVALSMDEVKMGQDQKLTVSMDKEQLKSHPRFEYAEQATERPRTGSSTSPAGSPGTRPGAGTSTPPASRTQ